MTAFFPTTWSYAFLTAVAAKLTLQLKSPIAREELLRALRKLQAELTELPEADHTPENGNYVLRNDHGGDDRRHVALLVSDGAFLQLSWGPDSGLDAAGIVRIVNAISGAMELAAAHVGTIDVQIHAESTMTGHQWAAIHDAYYGRGPLSDLPGGGQRVHDCRIQVRGSIDETRMYYVSAWSNVSDEEILTGRFEQDLLRAFVGFGLTRVRSDGALGEVARQHLEWAFSQYDAFVAKPVFEPLDAALGRESRRATSPIGVTSVSSDGPPSRGPAEADGER